eukprot:8759030-Alexandrium_andersonii.AAC.1
MAMSVMSASPMPTTLPDSSSWSSAAAKSNTTTPRSILSCACWGTGRPSRARWATMPRRIA